MTTEPTSNDERETEHLARQVTLLISGGDKINCGQRRQSPAPLFGMWHFLSVLHCCLCCLHYHSLPVAAVLTDALWVLQNLIRVESWTIEPDSAGLIRAATPGRVKITTGRQRVGTVSADGECTVCVGHTHPEPVSSRWVMLCRCLRLGRLGF